MAAVVAALFIFSASRPCRGMEIKTAQQVLALVHDTALAIANARTDLTVADQESLYKKILFGTLTRTLGSLY